MRRESKAKGVDQVCTSMLLKKRLLSATRRIKVKGEGKGERKEK